FRTADRPCCSGLPWPAVPARVLRTALHQQHDRSDLDDLVLLVEDLEPDFQNAALGRLARSCLQRRYPRADGVAELHRGVEFPGNAEQAERRSVDPVELRYQSDRRR